MMLRWLYTNWAKLSLFLSIVTTAMIYTIIGPENLLLFLIWIQLPIYLLHQFEEHNWNGFKNYINTNIFKANRENYPLNDKIIFWVNIPIVWIIMPIFSGLANINILFGLWIPYFAVINSLTHVIVSIKNREYNPGLLVSLTLGIPVGVYALVTFYTYIQVPLLATIISLFIAISLHLLVFGYIAMTVKKE